MAKGLPKPGGPFASRAAKADGKTRINFAVEKNGNAWYITIRYREAV